MGDLFAVDPSELASARLLAHHACQWPSRAARANLEPIADDSHSNLGWDSDLQALMSHDLGGGRKLGFCFPDASLIAISDGAVSWQLDLASVKDDAGIGAATDEWLRSIGLVPATETDLPYSLSDSYNFDSGIPHAELKVLGDWYQVAHSALTDLIAAVADQLVGTPAVRCWPHHFDIAALCMLEAGDPETARSIGLGLSPGDDTFPEPYFYTNPWPTPAIGGLPEAEAPRRWHTSGFVSVIVHAGEMRGVDNFAELLEGSFRVARATL